MAGAPLLAGLRMGTFAPMLKLEDAEVFAARELQLAELDGHDSPPWDVLLHRRDVLVAEFGASSPIRGIGTHGTVRGQPVVYVHERLDRRARAFVALHEYAHALVEAEQLELECPLERFCNRFAASIVCPTPAVRRAWRDANADFPAALDLRPNVTGSTFALRLGESGVAHVAVFDRARPRYVEPARPMPHGIDRLVGEARRETYAESAAARAWRLPDAIHRVVVVFDAAA